MNKMEILGFMPILHINADEADVFYGEKAVEEAFLAFAGDFDAFYKNQIKQGVECVDDSEWDDNNKFMVLVDTKNEEVIGIRDHGRYTMNPSDYFLRSNLLPVFMNANYPVFFNDRIPVVLDMYESMLRDAKEKAKSCKKSPLIFIRHIWANEHIAWSLDEGREVVVDEYKTYRNSFKIRDRDTDLNYDPNEYFVYTPSEEIIKATDIWLFPQVWIHKMRWDDWEKREVMEINDELVAMIMDKELKGIYLRGIDLVNKGRMMDLGNDEDFANLEKRVERFGKLITLSAPKDIIRSEAELIMKSVRSIESRITIMRFKVLPDINEDHQG